METIATIDFSPVTRLTRDLKEASATLSQQEARYLVDLYYQMQDNRLRAAGQVRSGDKADEPCSVLRWAGAEAEKLEGQIKRALGAYSQGSPVGRWAESIVGIGPVISAGLLAHIDIEKCPTVGHIWRFAGLDPTLRWNKGEKRPWNAALKRLCWIASGSFVKFSGHEEGYYGRVWSERKAYEWAKNAAGDYAAQARESLAAKRWREDTATVGWYRGDYSGALVAAYQRAGEPLYEGAVRKIPTVTETADFREYWGRTDFEAFPAAQRNFATRFLPSLQRAGAAGPAEADGSGTMMLPPGRIDLRARRYAVKLFLSHWHHVAYSVRFGQPPPKPYIIEHGGHTHFAAPPNWRG